MLFTKIAPDAGYWMLDAGRDATFRMRYLLRRHPASRIQYL